MTPEEQAAADRAAADKAAADKAAADKAAADKAAADRLAAEQHVSAEYAARLRREAEENRKRAESFEAENKALKDAEAARVAKQLADEKEFQKLAQHHAEKAAAAEKALAEERAQAAKQLETERARADKQLADERNARIESDRRRQLEIAAAAAGLRDADDIDKLDKSKITWGDDGKPVGVDAAFEDLKTRKPHYFKLDPTPAPTPQPRNLFAVPPAPAAGGGGTKDAYALSPEDFEREYAQLGRVQRA